MLQIEKEEERRRANSYYLKPSTVDLLKEIARCYDTTASKVLEAMVVQFGPKILEDKNANSN